MISILTHAELDRASPNNEDDESSGNEGNEGARRGSWKYKKKTQALRVSGFPALDNVSFPPTEMSGGKGGKWSFYFAITSLCPCYPHQTIQ